MLYLGWEPEEGGHLSVFDSDDNPTKIDPKPGRVVLFMSQEVEHEVLKSSGDRFALTMWIWDQKKDQNGR